MTYPHEPKTVFLEGDEIIICSCVWAGKSQGPLCMSINPATQSAARAKEWREHVTKALALGAYISSPRDSEGRGTMTDERKIIQIVPPPQGVGLYALCNDGTLWYWMPDNNGSWIRIAVTLGDPPSAKPTARGDV